MNSLSLNHWLTFSADPPFQPYETLSLTGKARAKGQRIPPPNIYFSCKFWHVLKYNRITLNPDSYLLGKYSKHKATAQNGKHYHKAISFCSKRWLKKRAGTISFRPHIQVCLLDCRGLVRTPSSWILSWFICIRRTPRRSASPSQQ